MDEAFCIFFAEAVSQELHVQRHRIRNAHVNELGRDIRQLQSRLPAEGLILRLGRTATDLVVELTLNIVFVEVDPALHRQRHNSSNLFARHVLLHQLDDALAALGKNELDLHQTILGARIRSVGDHCGLSRRTTSRGLRIPLRVVRDAGDEVHVVLDHR